MMQLPLLLMTITMSRALEDSTGNLSGPGFNNLMQGVQGNQINKTIIDKNIGILFGPSNNIPTVGTNGDHKTTTSAPCQCLPYYLCNDKKVGDNANNPEITGTGLIEVRFADEGCAGSLELCCTIPNNTTTTTTKTTTTKTTTTTNTTVQEPTFTKPKGCGYNNPNGIDFKMVGAKVITDLVSQFGEFPWAVAVMDTRDDTYAGAGVLIHPQVVLTVAHIASKYSQGVLKIRAGEWDTKTTEEPYAHQERRVQQSYIHPEYNPVKLWNDVAILHLETPVNLDKHINTICLPNQGERFVDTKNCVANGWGKDRYGKDVDFAVILKKIEVDIVEHSVCNIMLRLTPLGINYNLHSSFICAGGKEGKDTCTGDGGGPLACPIGDNRYKLTGLVAAGIGCGQKNVPGVYASLIALRSWVDENMNLLGYGTSSYTI